MLIIYYSMPAPAGTFVLNEPIVSRKSPVFFCILPQLFGIFVFFMGKMSPSAISYQVFLLSFIPSCLSILIIIPFLSGKFYVIKVSISPDSTSFASAKYQQRFHSMHVLFILPRLSSIIVIPLLTYIFTLIQLRGVRVSR